MSEYGKENTCAKQLKIGLFYNGNNINKFNPGKENYKNGNRDQPGQYKPQNYLAARGPGIIFMVIILQCHVIYC